MLWAELEGEAVWGCVNNGLLYSQLSDQFVPAHLGVFSAFCRAHLRL